MDEGRLKAVKKGQKLHRKFAYAMNDTIRTRQNYYQSCLSREEQEAHTRLMSKVMDIRRNVVRNRVLLQCLSLHRQGQPDRAVTEPLLGSYGGRPLDSFSRDIDQRLAWFHPRLRRLRKVDRVRQNCLKYGAILDEETIKDRMQSFFSKNLVLDTPQAMGKLQKQELGGTNTTNNNKMDGKRVDKKDGDNKGTNDDGNDDDDDFDIRDYHNPIAGANFKLRLHPFGNMVDFDNKGESKKFNLQTRRNVFNNSKLDTKLAAASRTTRSVPHPPHRDGHDAVASSLPSSTRESPLRLSKYPDPLPPITSGDRKKPKTPKVSDGSSGNVQNGGQHGNIGVVSDELIVESGSTIAHTSDDREARTQRSDQNAGLSQSEVEKEKTKCAEDMPKLTRRKTLILPPIETSKEMVHNKN